MDMYPEAYKVRLTQFEGPLDLLLHLIRRDKINIYDIPISQITSEYLEYIGIMKELELEIAGEFFVMAATLIRIKAQMLLPRRSEENEEEEDPRDELVRNLLEYKRFKEAAQQLAAREEERRKQFTRPSLKQIELKDDKEELNVTLYDLIDAFKEVVKNFSGTERYVIEKENITIEEKIELISEMLRVKSEVLFSELFSGSYSKLDIIVTFLALLELVRRGDIRARQMEKGSDIWIYGKKVAGL